MFLVLMQHNELVKQNKTKISSSLFINTFSLVKEAWKEICEETITKSILNCSVINMLLNTEDENGIYESEQTIATM